MKLFATDLEGLAFLLEAHLSAVAYTAQAGAALTLDPDTPGLDAAEQSAPANRQSPST